jgi:hypothetical protein
MKFKKDDEWTRKCGKKGNLATLKKYKKLGRVFKKDDTWTIECRKKSHETRKTLGHYSMMGKLSRFYENRVARQLNPKFNKIWQPQEICDRIAIKNGNIFFIEIKTRNRELTKNQKEFQKLAKNKYIVIRSS